MGSQPDVVVVSLGTTMGLRHADEALVELVREAGATCELLRVRIGRLAHLRRTMSLTDLAEAYAARRSATAVRAKAIVYSSITAALLQRPRRPYAVRFDSLAALNRPGLGGTWQRRREVGILERARLLLPWSDAGAEAAAACIRSTPATVALPPRVDGTAFGDERNVDAVAYGGNPHKRGLELLCQAWADGAPPGARLIVGGVARETAERYLRRARVAAPPAVEWAGVLPREQWLDLVRRARVFVSASRYEDWGLAQMEALAAGTPLVTVPSAGLNEALSLARRLSPPLVARDRSRFAFASALRAGLGMDTDAQHAYAAEAARLLVRYRRPALRRVVAEDVLPTLLG